ncbi:MAG: S41 family peptidase [Labilithrix sp.]|nr:S41 family peptidase [Labilithrix sp.]
MRKAGFVVAALVPACVVGWAILHAPPPVPVIEARPPPAATAPVPPVSSSSADDGHDDERSYVFRIPSGEPTSLSCEEARTIVEQVRAGLAYTPEAVKASTFAASAADWLDPHGFPDPREGRTFCAVAPEGGAGALGGRGGQEAAGLRLQMTPGAVLESWVGELRDAFDKGRRSPGSTVAASAALEPMPPTGGARETAEELGRRAGAFEAAYGAEGARFADEARRRFFPPLDKAGWSRVVLASAVRAYVPLVDPHGEWAPFDEESRIYEVDLASRPPSRLWGRALLTAIGVRVTESATPPLAIDDVVLSVANVATAGLPLEQVDQLGFAAGDARSPLSAVVLRAGRIVTLEVGHGDEAEPPLRAAGDLPFERVAFGEGDALIVSVKDVRDDLGDDLAAILGDERERGPRRLNGVVLDLRGNGGGSTDGALGALALFMPGAPLFAMRRRDGTVEIDRAPVPRDRDRWTGAVATFVDGTTASAAEMIAGALAAYRRAPSVGSTTFGKGCAQEYVDDDAHAGVLRLTTLVYALPDGTPVQRVGLVPQIRFPVHVDGPSPARPRSARRSSPTPRPLWRGPDVRDPSSVASAREEAGWPAHGGNVGPCQDIEICRALRLLGGARRAPTAKH